MDVDEYLSGLQSELDNQLSSLGLDGQQSASSQSSQDVDEQKEFQFCPECGSRVEADVNFCPNCGSRLGENEDAEDGDEASDVNCAENVGIIFTDTGILASKYGVSIEDVDEMLSSFMHTCEQYDQDWRLLDMHYHQDELGEATWMDYSDVLQQYIKDNDIKPGPKLSLFIIGGNDVIPQPSEANPCFQSSPWTDDSYEDHVYADFYYCFYGQLPLQFFDFNKARCNVARLPLESGEMDTTLEEDLQAYFNLSNMITDEGGIHIGRAVMTSNYDWIPASREMARNLPTQHLDDEKNVVLDNMFLSPNIMADMDDDLQDLYSESLANADMLVFNLHGACDPDQSSFYSNDEAFSIDMLSMSNARIFNTVACWGGRYIKYRREQSMLLSALYGNGVLLYSGACVPAMGKCGNFQQDDTWSIQPAAYSETFMARFAQYQCIGTMSAGEAFLKAKCDYYNSSRGIEEDEMILGTVLMFNLYGNPMLRTRPNVDVLAEIQDESGAKYQPKPFVTMKRTSVMQCNSKSNDSMSLLNEIRNCVDTNLRLIHKAITQNLYNVLGLEPRQLFSVEKFETTNAKGQRERGYLYNYGVEHGPIKSNIRVRLDELGNIISALQTK